MVLHSKKKIVVLSAFYEPFMSGAEQMVKEIVERLGDQYKMTLITARLDKSLPKMEKRKVFTLIRVGLGYRQVDKLLYPILSAIKVWRIKPKIVHAIMESYAGGALMLIKYLYPKSKRILTLQSGNLEDNIKQSQFLVKFFWRRIHQAPQIITAISLYLARRPERLGIDKGRVYITSNGIDLSHIPGQAEKISNRVIFLGRLSYEKGLDYLLAAWPQVLRQVPEAKLMLVGEGDKRTELERLIKEFNINDSVELKGNLPHGRALAEIKKSEIFICPSLAEGLGNVFIEAQACGVPPIGTNVGGIPDIIKDNENGLLIEPKNSEAIAAAIIKLLKDKELAKRLSLKGLETVKKFDWQNIIRSIDLIYQEAISS